MFQEVLPDFFRIGVPLPDNPLRELNAYLVRGPRNLLIDNGFNTEESGRALRQALDELEVNLNDTDFFITHLHSDHNGLTGSLLSSPASKVLCGREEGEQLNRAIAGGGYWNSAPRRLVRLGFSGEEATAFMECNPGRIYLSARTLPITSVADGDCIRYGRYVFSVLEVPGHTPGHVSLFEATTRTYVSGDHILGKITPNITSWEGVADSLGDYLKSLDKTAALPIERTLPGHRHIIENTGERIRQLKEHHAERLEEVRGILRSEGALSAYGAASRMKWSLRGSAWSEFRLQQKVFAAGEAMAHLERLEAEGGATREERETEIVFRLS